MSFSGLGQSTHDSTQWRKVNEDSSDRTINSKTGLTTISIVICSATFSHLPFQTTKMDENNEEMTPDARLAWLRERVSLRVIEGLKGGTSGKSETHIAMIANSFRLEYRES
jgi:hypothetical protein